jgi:hypothetical protein
MIKKLGFYIQKQRISGFVDQLKRGTRGQEICKRERNMDLKTTDVTDVLPETVAHIESAGCKVQKKSVIGAHNLCWKYLLGAISTHGEVTRDLEFIGGDKDKQLEQLWAETRIGNILPWDERICRGVVSV